MTYTLLGSADEARQFPWWGAGVDHGGKVEGGSRCRVLFLGSTSKIFMGSDTLSDLLHIPASRQHPQDSRLHQAEGTEVMVSACSSSRSRV